MPSRPKLATNKVVPTPPEPSLEDAFRGADGNATSDQAALPTTDQAVKPARERKIIHPAKTYRIDPQAAARLKAWAALNKRTEQEIVEELIWEFLERVGG